MIDFKWDTIFGLISWDIKPEFVEKEKVKATHIPNKNNNQSLSTNMRRIIPRNRESKGKREIIKALKIIELRNKRKSQ
jgi:hypothetical protein